MVRNLSVTSEAWRNGELAHCYYYKSDAVIKDVAEQIAKPDSHRPDRSLPLMTWFSTSARWLVVLLYVLGIFVVAVPRAEQLEKNRIAEEKANVEKASAEKANAEAAAKGALVPVPVNAPALPTPTPLRVMASSLTVTALMFKVAPAVTVTPPAVVPRPIVLITTNVPALTVVKPV